MVKEEEFSSGAPEFSGDLQDFARGLKDGTRYPARGFEDRTRDVARGSEEAARYSATGFEDAARCLARGFEDGTRDSAGGFKDGAGYSARGLEDAARCLARGFADASRYFADPDVCVRFVAGVRWADGPVCPYCGGMKVSYLRTRRIFKCMGKECHKQFSVKVGTIFEDSAIPLEKWLRAIWLVVNCRNGISSYEMARELKVTQKSAWFMLHRIRLALANSSWFKLGGEEGGPVGEDGSLVGGKERKKRVPNRRFIPDGKGGFMENPDYERRKGASGITRLGK